MSVHVKEHEMLRISGIYHYALSHNHILILERKTPDIIISMMVFQSDV